MVDTAYLHVLKTNMTPSVFYTNDKLNHKKRLHMQWKSILCFILVPVLQQSNSLYALYLKGEDIMLVKLYGQDWARYNHLVEGFGRKKFTGTN